MIDSMNKNNVIDCYVSSWNLLFSKMRENDGLYYKITHYSKSWTDTTGQHQIFLVRLRKISPILKVVKDEWRFAFNQWIKLFIVNDFYYQQLVRTLVHLLDKINFVLRDKKIDVSINTNLRVKGKVLVRYLHDLLKERKYRRMMRTKTLPPQLKIACIFEYEHE
jgi:hypothetical protein